MMAPRTRPNDQPLRALLSSPAISGQDIAGALNHLKSDRDPRRHFPTPRAPARDTVIGPLPRRPGRCGPGGNPCPARCKAVLTMLPGDSQARHALGLPALNRGRRWRGSADGLGSCGAVCEARTWTRCSGVAVGNPGHSWPGGCHDRNGRPRHRHSELVRSPGTIATHGAGPDPLIGPRVAAMHSATCP